MRTVAVVTVARSDFGIYRPILRRLEAQVGMCVRLITAAAHLDPRFGATIREIEGEGFEVHEWVAMPPAVDTAADVAETTAQGLREFSRIFARARPDILLLAGDRFEMHAAALAALPFAIPVGHI